jgi:hypothetical protein
MKSWNRIFMHGIYFCQNKITRKKQENTVVLSHKNVFAGLNAIDYKIRPERNVSSKTNQNGAPVL